MVRAGAEKAVGTLIAQEAIAKRSVGIATHFYQNPDQLPSDLKAQLEGARGNFTQSRSNTNKAAYNPQNLINLAMQKIQETGVKWAMIPKVTTRIWQPAGNILIDMDKTVPFERLQFL